MLEAIRIALGFAYAGIGFYTIAMVERHHKEDHEDVLNARRDATNKSCENWSALYDYTCNEHTKEIMNRVPGLRQMLAKKVDVFGNDKQNSAGGTMLQRVVNTMLIPAYYSVQADDRTANELYRLYEGGYEDAIFPVPSKSLNGITLSAAERREYRGILGSMCYENVSRLIASQTYKSYTDSQKADAIERAITNCKSGAKKKFIAAHPEYNK